MAQPIPGHPRAAAFRPRRPGQRGLALGAAASALVALALVLAALLLSRAPGPDGRAWDRRGEEVTAQDRASSGPAQATATISGTGAVSNTATLAATATLSGTVATAATATVDATAAVSRTATAPASATRGAEPTVTITGTAAVSATATADFAAPDPTPASRTTFMPLAAKGALHTLPTGRVWGLQFAWDDVPDEHRKAVALELRRPASLGMGSVRTMLRWSQIEPRNSQPEDYDWSKADELLGDYSKHYDVLVSIVDYPAWATVYRCGYDFQPGMETEWREFIGALAARYSRPPYRIAGWEISNEVDIKTTIDDQDRARHPDWGGGQPTVPVGGCFGDRPEAYLRFLRSAREAIKAVDPTAVVTLGGLAYVSTVPGFHPEFLERFLALGGGQQIDVMNLHWFPDIPTEPSGLSKLAAVRSLLAVHGLGKLPIWITETYRLTHPADPDSYRRQALFLTRDLLEVLAQPQVERVYWYGYVDFPTAYKGQPTDPDRGLVTAAYQAKPALRLLPLAITQTVGRPSDLSNERYRLLAFQVPRAAETRYVAWSLSGRAERVALPARAEGRAEAQLFPWSVLRDPAAALPAPVAIGVEEAQHLLDVGSEPIFVTVR